MEDKLKRKIILYKFNVGDWIYGIAQHKGCSPIFEGYGFLQPFSYLDDYNPEHFRLATKEEIENQIGIEMD